VSEQDDEAAAVPGNTMPASASAAPPAMLVRRVSIQVLEPASAAATFESSGETSAIGSAPTNDVVIDDRTVSRFHCELVIDADGVRVRDLRSKNGTVVDGVRVQEAWLKDSSLIRLGDAVVRCQVSGGANRLPLAERTELGGLVGRSVAMRHTFALLQRAAVTNATVLLEGETGTGKGAAAEAVHRASPRAAGPFVIVDCGAIPATLLESELFGHEKGAFTGADGRRIGAFEEAHGGTVFLDEIGELPVDLQPKLLRALESRQVRRLGSNQHATVDFRLIAATNRDLRAEVNAGRFRADLYYRLAVVRVPMPTLRQRPEDLELLTRRILSSLGAPATQIDALLTPTFIATLQSSAWPGNVRELRNYLERCLVFEEAQPMGDGGPGGPSPAIDVSQPYAVARDRAIAEFERRYVEALLEAHAGKVARAAEAAGVARVHVYRLMRKHGLPGR
jgi:DNA-binding NtrC family response regulator